MKTFVQICFLVAALLQQGIDASGASLRAEIANAVSQDGPVDGVCWKSKTNRPIGKVGKACKEGDEYQLGLCYSQCPENYTFSKSIAGRCDCIDQSLCSKKYTYQGIGKIPICGSDLVYDAGLCYEACPAGTKGIGFLCWGSCPAEFPTNGGIMCCTDSKQCWEFVQQLIAGGFGVLSAAMKDALNVVKEGTQMVGELASGDWKALSQLQSDISSDGGLFKDLEDKIDDIEGLAPQCT